MCCTTDSGDSHTGKKLSGGQVAEENEDAGQDYVLAVDFPHLIIQTEESKFELSDDKPLSLRKTVNTDKSPHLYQQIVNDKDRIKTLKESMQSRDRKIILETTAWYIEEYPDKGGCCKDKRPGGFCRLYKKRSESDRPNESDPSWPDDKWMYFDKMR